LERQSDTKRDQERTSFHLTLFFDGFTVAAADSCCLSYLLN
jgi:hypothetical protein